MASSTRTANFGSIRAIVAIVALSMVMLALTSAAASAHSMAAQATCSSVTFDWEDFAGQGGANNGLNTPTWTVTFTPVGGSPVTYSGSVSFPGATFSHTVLLPGNNGTVTASSVWTGAQTRDGVAGQASEDLTIANCEPPPPPPPIVPPVVPPPAPQSNVAPVTAQGVCVPSPSSKVLKGVPEKSRKIIKPYITATGVKSVTFYLDGRKLKTVTKPSGFRFFTTINTARLGSGAHRVSARVTLNDVNCARAAAARTFVRVKSAAIAPSFAG